MMAVARQTWLNAVKLLKKEGKEATQEEAHLEAATEELADGIVSRGEVRDLEIALDNKKWDQKGTGRLAWFALAVGVILVAYAAIIVAVALFVKLDKNAGVWVLYAFGVAFLCLGVAAFWKGLRMRKEAASLTPSPEEQEALREAEAKREKEVEKVRRELEEDNKRFLDV